MEEPAARAARGAQWRERNAAAPAAAAEPGVSKNEQKRRAKAAKAAKQKQGKGATASSQPLPKQPLEPAGDAGVAYLMDHAPLMGQDKWLGGVLGADGVIYGVPGHANRVLRIDPATGAVGLIGPELPGQFKWLRAIAAPNGVSYCLPCHSDSVLKIDCNASPPAITTFGESVLKVDAPGPWKWHGGVLSPIDQCIYAIPQFAESVLKIDTATEQVSTIGGPFPGASPTGKHKWYGGLLAGDGCIYGVPQCADSVLKIDPATQRVSTLGKLAPNGWKWHGGVVGRDGCVYGIPSNADTVLKIDPFAQELVLIPFDYTPPRHRSAVDERNNRDGAGDDGGSENKGKYKYLGGVFCPADGCIYCVPSDAEYVLRIDPAKGEAVEIGESLQGKVGYESNKWQNGFVAGDGRIYGIPLKADSVLCVEPDTERVYTVGSGLAGFDKWEGGVLAGGAVYCMPLKSKHVLRIAPAADAAPKPVDAAAAAPAAAAEAAPLHDALLPWLSTEDELGLLVRERLEADGYVVLPAVLSRDECAAALEKMWSFVEGVSPAVRRDAPDTWYPSAEGAADPWPHSGWRSFSDMFQDNGAGWLFGDERELLAERVFSKLYGTRELHASKEGFTFHRPTAGGRHPLVGKTAYVCGQPTSADNGGAHFDQGHAGSGLQCIQSSTALLDQQEDDGCFLCWPGSHRHHGALTEGIWRGRSPWVPLTDAELDTLRAAGLAPRRVPVGAGDVILWRSDLAHAGAVPVGERDGFRAVVYASMLPAALTPRAEYTKKVTAYRFSHTGDHCPSREHWHAAKPSPLGDVVRRHYYADGPPKLTKRQAELYGLVAYDGYAGNTVEDLAQ